MDPRLQKLINIFENKGWTLSGPVDISSDWWFQEIIRLKSEWRLLETNIYLTSLTDPQIFHKKTVWCIGISSEIPKTKSFKYIDQITLNDIKKIDLDLLVDKVNKVILK